MQLIAILFLVLGIVFHCQGSPVSTDSCSRCIEVVETFQVLSPMMSESVSNFCGALEEGDERKACRETVQEYSGKTPRDLCKVMGQCSQSRDDSDTLKFSPEIGKVEKQLKEETLDGSMVCTVCKLGISFVGRYLNGKHAVRVLMRLLYLGCHYIPFMSRTCFALVKEYGPLLVRLLKEFVKPGFCHTWLGCPALKHAVSAESPCRTCQLGAGIMYDTVHDKALGKRLNLLAQFVCGSSPNPYECLAESRKVTSALNHAASSLRDDADLKHFCKESDVCL